MITEIWTPDVFVDNDVFCLSAERERSQIQLGAVGWVMTGRPPNWSHRICLREGLSKIVSIFPRYDLWLLVSSLPRPISTVVRYRGLWGALRAEGVRPPKGYLPDEGATEGGGEIRFFGAARLELGGLDSAMDILDNRPASHIVALDHSDKDVVLSLIRNGWDYRRRGVPSLDVLTAVCGAGGVVLMVVGAFDDREAGVVGFSVPCIVERLVKIDG